jgi:serine/threonine protein kinase
MDRYTILAKIGSGSFSTVYKARDTQTDTIVAVKRVYFEGDGIPSGVVREISILQELQHENIVRLRDVVLERHETNDRVNMILDYVDQDLVI